jgi:hypothetical protein
MKHRKSHFEKTAQRASRALKDMEQFAEGMSHQGFIYRYGFLTSSRTEGAVVAMFDALTEHELEMKIKRLDKRFHEYTDSRVQREYCKKAKCWFGTYVVCFPFDNAEISGRNDWQAVNPLF